MSLQDWANSGWLRSHKTSKQEVRQTHGNRRSRFKRRAPKRRLSGLAFWDCIQCRTKLCTILLYGEGFRPEKTLAHYRTLQALPLILGSEKDDNADYLDTCRTKRNTVEYDYVGGATNSDADELIAYVMKLKIEVLGWLKQNHPDLSE